jgi:hypothetical protein
MSGHLYARDEETLYYVAEGLVEGRGFTISPQAPLVNAARGRDGQVYAQHPPGQALAAVPLYLAGRLAAAPLPAELRPFVTRLYVQTFNVWITAALGAIVAALALAWGARRSVAVVVALLLGLTTMQWVARPSSPATSTAAGLTPMVRCWRGRSLADLAGLVAGARCGRRTSCRPGRRWRSTTLARAGRTGAGAGRVAWWSRSGRDCRRLALAGRPLRRALLQFIFNTLGSSGR